MTIYLLSRCGCRSGSQPVADLPCFAGFTPAKSDIESKSVSRHMANLHKSPGTTVLLAVLVCGNSGCLFDSRFVQLPQLMPRHPATEHRAAEYHDPYPDESIGPSTGNRPTGFTRQRTATRRAAELRGIHLLDPGDRLPSTSAAPDRNRYSQVVSP